MHERSARDQALQKPLISVITSTLNAAELLPFTIASLRAQTYSAFEWIIVDGASTDGTLELLRQEQDVVTVLVSEPDQGIYDAWNKACSQARGEWLIFLGAGDALASANTLEACAEYLRATPVATVLAYGRLELLSAGSRSVVEVFGSPWQEICHKWEIGRPALPPHGAVFHRAVLFASASPFDLRFPIAADAHFLLKYTRQHELAFMPLTVTCSPIGGVSFRLDTAARLGREIAAINGDLGLVPPLSHRALNALRLALISVLGHLPPTMAHCIADLLRSLVGKRQRWTVR